MRQVASDVVTSSSQISRPARSRALLYSALVALVVVVVVVALVALLGTGGRSAGAPEAGGGSIYYTLD